MYQIDIDLSWIWSKTQSMINFHYHIQSPSFDLQWKNSEKMIIYLNLHIAWHPTMPWL